MSFFNEVLCNLIAIREIVDGNDSKGIRAVGCANTHGWGCRCDHSGHEYLRREVLIKRLIISVQYLRERV